MRNICVRISWANDGKWIQYVNVPISACENHIAHIYVSITGPPVLIILESASDRIPGPAKSARGVANAPRGQISQRASERAPRRTTSDNLNAKTLYDISCKEKQETLQQMNPTQFNDQVVNQMDNEDATDPFMNLLPIIVLDCCCTQLLTLKNT